MGRRKATEMKDLKAKGLCGYEAIWAHILEQHGMPFTIKDIEMQTFVLKQTVRDYVNRLVIAGYVERCPGKRDGAYLYKSIKRPLKAPRLRRDGTSIEKSKGRDHMWRTMKMLRTFTAKDLAISASTKETHIKEAYAEDYIKFLAKSGYLKVVQPAKRGGVAKGRAKAVYKFLPTKNTGPKAPIIQRVKCVYDPNLEQVVWAPAKGGSHE